MAAAAQDGLKSDVHPFFLDGVDGNIRFSDVPDSIDLPVPGTDDTIDLDLQNLADDPTELCTALEDLGAAKHIWLACALAYTRQHKLDSAIEIVNNALQVLSKAVPKDRLALITLLVWLYLWKARHSPRVISDDKLEYEVKTKEFYLQACNTTLNEATRASPSFPPLYVARGVLCLIRASLQPYTKTMAIGSSDERVDTLRQALKAFNDALKVSNGRNMMALLGKARALFSLGNFGAALSDYQEILVKMPRSVDPDPRIGIGCCLWQLGYKDEAKAAWERALEVIQNSSGGNLNPVAKIPTILLGIYYLHHSALHSPSDPTFASSYKKAMTEYTQAAFKLDKELPLTCATFGHYFLPRKAFSTVEALAKKAIELTDVNATASDGWYLLARKEHYQGDYARAAEFYEKSDRARGGPDAGFLPAKFGIAQMQVKQGNRDGAKYHLEKIIRTTKNAESMTLLGSLYAEEVFAARAAGNREDKSAELKKARALLEGVRLQWKDSKKHLVLDEGLLLCLARLYETDEPEKSVQCLQQVESMQLDAIPAEDRPVDTEDKTATQQMRETLLPQLLNNIACFQYHAEKYELARDTFQTALNACVKLGEEDDFQDTDALVTSISYNLARTYEASGMLDEAKDVYQGLLARHSDYTDANARLTYIALRQSPSDKGPKALSKLYETESSNLEVRALFGWYLSRAKKRTMNLAEDQEQRHYKHTLQHYDKHDKYSLAGMGNLYLTTAREMPRATEQDKEKRRKTYERAVEFLDKALQLDPKNAYAAQGVAIALADDKRDYSTAMAIFNKVRDTLRDASVHINLGHTYTELRQYTRAIENYEAALAKDRGQDPNVLACLGRVWLQKGKSEKSISAMQQALEYSNRALDLAPDGIHFKFNVAFVQIQLAQLIYTLPESQRTLADVKAASEGLEEAIEAFTTIAQSKNPPYHKHDLEQRANMGRNTMRKQLERATQAQKEYEEHNAAKLQAAREAREAAIRQREEERLKAEAAEAEHKRKIAEERQAMLEKAREVTEKIREDERLKEEAEFSADSETGERIKRTAKRRKANLGGKRKKKNAEDSDLEDENGDTSRARSRSSRRDSDDDERPVPKKKKRRLERKSKGKTYKSEELVVDSDEEFDNFIQDRSQSEHSAKATDAETDEDTPMPDLDDGNDEEKDEEVTIRSRRKRTKIAIDDEDDEVEDEEEEAARGRGKADSTNGEVNEDTGDGEPSETKAPEEVPNEEPVMETATGEENANNEKS